MQFDCLRNAFPNGRFVGVLNHRQSDDIMLFVLSAGARMNELELFEKTMTVREVANTLGVAESTVRNIVGSHGWAKNGVRTQLTEEQITIITKEMKSNSSIAHQKNSLLVTSKVATRLEILENYKSATEALISMLESEKAELQAENEKQKEQLAEQKPLVDGYQMFLSAHNSFSMQETAAMLKDENGKSPYGRNSLIEKLRAECILLSKPKPAIPYREYIDRGYFEVKTSVQNGIFHDSTLVFPKGLDYLAKRLGLIVEYKEVA